MERKYLMNSFWLIGYKIIIAVFNLLFNIIIARRYHGDVFGMLNYGLSIVSILLIIASLGMNSVLVDEFAKKPREKEKIFMTCFSLKLGLSIILIIILTVYLNISTQFDAGMKKIVFLQLFILIPQAFDILDFWLISISKSKINVRNTVIVQVLFINLKVFSLLWLNSIEVFIVFGILQTFFIGILNFLYFNKFKESDYKFSLNTGKTIVKRSYHLILTEFTIIIYTQLDKIMIGRILDVKEVGLYTAAASLAGVWSFILLAIANSYAPKIFFLKSEGKIVEYEKILTYLYSLLLFLGIIFTFTIFILSKPLILILYGKEYLYSIKLLRILSISSFFATFGSIRGCTWMIAEDKQSYSKYFCLFGAVINISLNLIFIAKLRSYGAAVSTLVTEIIVTVVAPLVFIETRPFIRLFLKSFISIPKAVREVLELNIKWIKNKI